MPDPGAGTAPVRVPFMRRMLLIVTLVFAAVPWMAADQRGPASAPPASMLTIDSIVRGPRLVGTPPSAVRWSKAPANIYCSRQRAADDRSATFVVNRDGSGLKQLTAEESRNLDVPQTGRFDRARKRVLT